MFFSFFSPPPPPPPSDPTLTVNKVIEVMGQVGDWKKLGSMLGVPESNLTAEIKHQCSIEEESCKLGEHWVNTDPDASWEKLAWALYKNGEERAMAMAKQYLPKGTWIS